MRGESRNLQAAVRLNASSIWIEVIQRIASLRSKIAEQTGQDCDNPLRATGYAIDATYRYACKIDGGGQRDRDIEASQSPYVGSIRISHKCAPLSTSLWVTSRRSIRQISGGEWPASAPTTPHPSP